jgi:predicted RNase H-like HicB family nuclease
MPTAALAWRLDIVAYTALLSRDEALTMLGGAMRACVARKFEDGESIPKLNVEKDAIANRT